ncbi:hypothetical protein BHE74_00047334, partial [Ensete ventricosum]
MGACQDGTREFVGRRPRLARRLLGVAERLAESWEDDAVGPHREFTRRFAKGIMKLAGNTMGDRRKKTGRFTVRISEAAELTG